MLVPMALAIGMASPVRLQADTIVLHTGARIEGTVLNPHESPREKYILQLDDGARLILSKNQVARVVPQSKAEADYERYLAKMPNTAEGHWLMAEWCVRNNLPAQREFHLRSLLEFEPEHEKARLALGYTNIDGRWVKPEEHNQRLGYVKYKGAWRTPQDVALSTAREQAQSAERKWKADIKTWRGWLNRPSKQAEGLANLQAIDDPRASPALVELLDDQREPPHHKMLYVELLGRMAPRSPLARGALVNQALYSPDPQLRDKCLDYLANCDKKVVAQMFVMALRDKKNEVVNRAAVGIARMNDPDAIPALIEALTTTHRYVVNSGGGGSIGASFSPSGSSFSAGNGPQQVERERRNEHVLNALTAMTGGKNFSFDKDAWRQWYAESKLPERYELRRAP